MIRSDGHTVEFIYGIRHSSSGGLPDLTMSDISDLSDLPTDLQRTLMNLISLELTQDIVIW
jgi:hypothetical protein